VSRAAVLARALGCTHVDTCDLWRLVVACGGLWWLVVACGGLWRLVAACGGLWSAQLASAIPPLSPCNATTPPSPCGVIYTTHGAGVDAGSPTWTGAYRSQVGVHVAFLFMVIVIGKLLRFPAPLGEANLSLLYLRFADLLHSNAMNSPLVFPPSSVIASL
jgi:hypothetical protein